MKLESSPIETQISTLLATTTAVTVNTIGTLLNEIQQRDAIIADLTKKLEKKKE